jgi:hypothetical protein
MPMLQLKKTPCLIPFSAAVERYHEDEHHQRFTNQTDCAHCKREFTEDTENRRWYPSEEITYGAEPHSWDRVVPVQTQHGWFCSERCHDKHVAEAA